MQKILYWTLGIVVLVGIAVFLFLQPFTPATSETPRTDSNTPSLPSGGSVTPGATGQNTLAVGANGGGTIAVKDFIHNSETARDVVNPDSYYVAGVAGYCLQDGTCPSGATTTDFTISYDEKNQFFNIVLLNEPLKDVRERAEILLMDRLAISQSDMCRLKYFVGVPYWINDFYSNKNLGFSFCPKAVQFQTSN